jgi:hypothetical protein
MISSALHFKKAKYFYTGSYLKEIFRADEKADQVSPSKLLQK